MSTTTKNLGLFKYDIVADENVPFNITNALNNNWDKLDEAISNTGGARNVGEIVASTIPLTDASLHLLDGSLIQGDGIYSDFVDYMANVYKTKDRIYNSAAFTVVGSPNITDDGIASGFSLSNCLETPTIDLSKPWEVELTCDTTNGRGVPFSWGANDKNYFTFKSDRTQIFIAELSLSATAWTAVDLNAKYNIAFGWDGTEYYLNVYNLDGTLYLSKSITSSDACANSKFTIGKSAWENSAFGGSIDLKQFPITVDGVEVLNGSKPANYFCIETEWQDSVTTYGVCGKFVYDSTNNTVRLPKVTGIVEGTTDINALGDLVEAGLPNILGSWATTTDGTQLSNAIYQIQDYGGDLFDTHDGGGWGSARKLGFDASRSNSIYGNSTTVQPQTIKVLYYIVVATTSKTDIQVDIDEIATDMNGKADVDGTNMVSSVKNFDGQWISSTFTIISSATVTGNTGYQYDLSNYLPNDNKKYEVLFTVWGQTGESSGNGLYVYAGTDIIGSGTNDASGKAQILRIRAVNSYAQYGASSVILPVGTGRKLYLYFSNSADASGINVKAFGYRRIGTNM